MTVCVQRVLSASVSVAGEVCAAIDRGLLVLLGVEQGDTEENALFLARKCVGLRIFEDENGKMNRSLADIGGKLLVVSNFTLCGDWAKGRRPSFTRAEAPEKAKALCELLVNACRQEGFAVETGVFGADMQVSLVNDGPVTLLLDTNRLS
ncbi:MAG TPA: D-tyrosyl-tRNA(Tyr) deacylase [Clostridiales bacterium]|jgi:D-tyrosyl-tRNA(Tyr) deacylase|nr:D-tyrosyl-tRNA(Tyr) deacylase [Clostridiales bacterium]